MSVPVLYWGVGLMDGDMVLDLHHQKAESFSYSKAQNRAGYFLGSLTEYIRMLKEKANHSSQFPLESISFCSF